MTPPFGELAALLAGVVLSGLLLSRGRPTAGRIFFAWAVLALGTVAAERLSATASPGVRVLAIRGALLYGFKAVVTLHELARGAQPLSAMSWLIFATLWPGMNPGAFQTAASPGAGAAELLRRGLFWGTCGAAVFGLALTAAPHSPGAAALLCVVGLSLQVHFGLFHLLAAGWRRAGYRTDALFRAPLAATSLGEFWRRRWNLAFSDLTLRAVYRPLVGRVGRRGALLAAFAFSGILHELALSVPVRAGYGLPTLYFIVHGVLVSREAAWSGWAGRLRVWFWLLAPLPLLLHPEFVAGVVLPLLDGAASR